LSGKHARAARRAVAVQAAKSQRKKQRQSGRSMSRRTVAVLLAIPIIVGGLYALTALGKGGGGRTASHGSGSYPYAVGSPGPGALAPALRLPSTGGGTFDLASYRGKAPVLLYFQEGLTCEPCWTQLQAIQKDVAKFHALGIGPIVSITTDPLGDIEQKVKDEGITIPVLSDVGAKFSRSGAWGANRYQMQMMGDRNGHTFVLVGKNGRIRWRADYGGAPKYTMYVPDATLLAQMRKGMNARS
jgi:peroxiredoxin Q/BCP